MDFSDAFRLVNLATGGLMVAGGVIHLLSSFFTIAYFVPGLYIIVFGLAIALLEFQIPPQVSRYASFLFSFLGRGIFYIFAGSLILDDWILNKIFGAVVGLIGIAYVVLEFVPSIEPPANMREADGGWGAEQV